MRFPRVLRPLLLGYLILHLLMAGVFVLVLSRIVRNQMIRGTQTQMRAMTDMLAEHIRELDQGLNDKSLPRHVRVLGEQTGMRLTLITADGKVAADSNTGTQNIGPHGDRPEVVLARQSGNAGFSERFSTTVDQPMIYFARVYPDASGQPEGFVRVAVPSSTINSAIGSMQLFVWGFAAFLSALTASLMLILSVRIMRPFGHFSEIAKQIGEGIYNHTAPTIRRNDEWGELNTAFEQMQSELSVREDRLVENSQRLEAVLSSMIEGVLAIEPAGEVMLANGAACKMLSLTSAELVGRKLLEIVRIPELRAAVEKTQLQREFSKTEFKTLSAPQRTLKARVSLLTHQNKSGVAIVLHDVTELRQLETMRQDFVANVSHELKTPLASIKAYAETLRLGAINDQEKNLSFVEQIEFQAELLNRQIQDLLQLARVESGEKAFTITDVDLNQICQSCYDQFLPVAKDRQLSLELNLANTAPLTRGDADAIKTVVKNLVVNAIHYTQPSGKITLSTEVTSNEARIDVLDTGIGIAPDQQGRVFERFYRVDKARSRDMGGTGLGLAIVKHLTIAFGGTVHLQSQPGKGSRFQIRLPLRSKLLAEESQGGE